jgi:arylsulfatase A-like enzyme
MPNIKTLAQSFRDAGYQAYAVGKLHVYPQRDRIGFDDVMLSEEARYQFGVTDDYEMWLGENGYLGQEYSHGMSNNQYYTRPWHLPEEAHQTTWATAQMVRTIKRKDPTRPAFYYLSYVHPHPPLVPLQA